MKQRTKAAAPSRTLSGCPIVGVGASAGGLEAFSQLLAHLPTNTGLGFVLVQHLDAQHSSALPQLLARATSMPVLEAKHNVAVQANCVYVIPPNAGLGIVGGVLQVRPRTRARIAPRSIDDFLEALAHDQCDRAIGIVLSGNATDGTLGLEAIRAAGGLTFAQDDSARFTSMPRSAVAAGCVDFVLPPEAIAKELAFIAKHPLVAGQVARGHPAAASPADSRATLSTHSTAASTAMPQDGASLDEIACGTIIDLLRQHSGVNFSQYKQSMILRRMTRRVVLNRLNTLTQYAEFLKSHPDELDTLYVDVLINVTGFFRNADAYAVLTQRVFPSLLAAGGDEALRVWVLGCSTGQEAYSIAMAYAEATDRVPRPRQLQIFATDLNESNLEKARRGLYVPAQVSELSPERLERFFVEEAGGFRVSKALREQVVFARHNLISDPPFSRMDLISCRNVMIYLEQDQQQRALRTFHYALKPKGYLFLGASESVGTLTNLFAPIDTKHKIFQRKAAAPAFPMPPRGQPRVPVGAAPRRPTRVPRPSDSGDGALSAEREADRIVLSQFAPPSVLVDAEMRILQFRGQTGAFLEPPTGKASLDLLKMARPGLLVPLRAGIERARMEDGTVRLEAVPFTLSGEPRLVNIEIITLRNLEERRYLVLFEDSTRPSGGARRTRESPSRGAAEHPDESQLIAQLEQDLADAREYLQAVQEYQEAATEELQASHEEEQSANEELQSLNEELETSKEELESTNEELTTLNEEMAGRNLELNRLNSDLTNLLTSAKLVVLLLGRDLTIRRFSAQAEQQFHLLPSDLGRPISSVRHLLTVPDLDALITDVIVEGRERERDVQDQHGHWYSLCVRPYLTNDGRVDGAVFLLMDIDTSKRAEQAIARARDFAEAVIDTVCDPLLVLDGALHVQRVNEAFATTFRTKADAVTGRSLFIIGAKRWESPELRALLVDVLAHQTSFDNFEITRSFPKIGRRTFVLNARTLSHNAGRPEKILLGLRDTTEQTRTAEALRKAQAHLADHAERLEAVVAQRTTQLTRANSRLAASLASTRMGREENHRLLQESRAMQQKLRLLTRQILTTQEEERKQISRELHDEVVQSLIGIKLALSTLMQGEALDAKVLKARIATSQRVVESAVDAVHRFARDLRPAVLDDLGLVPALRAYCKRLGAQHALRIEVTAFSGVERLDDDKRTALFRVATEALTNAAKHARATRVTVAITKTSQAVRMRISDNGKAASATKLRSSASQRLGIAGMRERVEMVGGTLSIESTRGKGTTVRVEIPRATTKRPS